MPEWCNIKEGIQSRSNTNKSDEVDWHSCYCRKYSSATIVSQISDLKDEKRNEMESTSCKWRKKSTRKTENCTNKRVSSRVNVWSEWCVQCPDYDLRRVYGVCHSCMSVSLSTMSKLQILRRQGSYSSAHIVASHDSAFVYARWRLRWFR